MDVQGVNMVAKESPEELKHKLNLETSRINWHDLQVYYARGHVVKVVPELDLLEVAAELSADNKAQFERWLADNKVGDVAPNLARHWYDENTELWAVVIAPWVLVQDRSGHVLH
jgi:hypothetical protein